MRQAGHSLYSGMEMAILAFASLGSTTGAGMLIMSPNRGELNLDVIPVGGNAEPVINALAERKKEESCVGAVLGTNVSGP